MGRPRGALESRQVWGAAQVLREALEHAGEAVMVMDGRQRVVLWNEVAERLLGWRKDEVLGRPCHRVMTGHDRDGHLVCCPGCPEMVMARANEPIPPREVCFRCRDGRYVWVSQSTLVVRVGPGEDELWVVHMFRDITNQRRVEELVDLLAQREGYGSTPSTSQPLTRREREVLGMLAQGMDTQAIAGALFLSSATVRNHIQNLMRKLGAHTRAQAVARALKEGLLPPHGLMRSDQKK